MKSPHNNKENELNELKKDTGLQCSGYFAAGKCDGCADCAPTLPSLLASIHAQMKVLYSPTTAIMLELAQAQRLAGADAGGLVPLSKDGESVWIEGEGAVPLCRCVSPAAEKAGGLSNQQIRTIMHNYSRMHQPGHYSDTEFDCLQDVIGFVRECIKQTGATAADHDLYTDADENRPDVICDSNGQVVLGLCKKCGKGECELVEQCTHKVVAAPSQPIVPAVPEGWKLVPVEPTEVMIHAAEDVPAPRPFSKVYRAMLSAAPAAPTTGEG